MNGRCVDTDETAVHAARPMRSHDGPYAGHGAVVAYAGKERGERGWATEAAPCASTVTYWQNANGARPLLIRYPSPSTQDPPGDGVYVSPYVAGPCGIGSRMVESRRMKVVATRVVATLRWRREWFQSNDAHTRTHVQLSM